MAERLGCSCCQIPLAAPHTETLLSGVCDLLCAPALNGCERQRTAFLCALPKAEPGALAARYLWLPHTLRLCCLACVTCCVRPHSMAANGSALLSMRIAKGRCSCCRIPFGRLLTWDLLSGVFACVRSNGSTSMGVSCPQTRFSLAHAPAAGSGGSGVGSTRI
jgi:hypothetical protein